MDATTISRWIADLMAVTSWQMAGNIASLLLMATMMIAFWKAHRNTNSCVWLEDMFAEEGRIGGSKMRLNGAWLLLSWILVYMTLKGSLTEWLVGIYIAAFVYDRQKSREAAALQFLDKATKPTNEVK